MYILYLDESGLEHGTADGYFVLGGAAIFERQTYFLSSDLDTVQAHHFPGLAPIDFHAAPIRTGKGRWRSITKEKRSAVLRDVADVIANANQQGLYLFCAAIEKTDSLSGEEAVKRATEEITGRFDILLKRLHRAGNTQRGLIVFAEGRFHQRARIWVKSFRELGTRWGVLNNLSDIPYFAAAQETRLLQLADYVAHAVFRLYEHRDPILLAPIIQRFDQQGGTLHGLVHVRSTSPCDCPACHSRRIPYDNGPWLGLSS